MCKEEELTVHDMCEKCKSIIRKHEYGYILSEMEEKRNLPYPNPLEGYKYHSQGTDSNGISYVRFELIP